MAGILTDIQQALEAYLTDWAAWAQQEATTFPFADLTPMHAGWKVPDEASLGQTVAQLLPSVQQGHIGTVDNRKIALLVPQQPIHTIPILQIMQLRPHSTDPLGLDHVAFYCANIASLQAALQQSTYTWEQQSNPGHTWLSLWFGDAKREVKFFDHTSLDLGAHELTEASNGIKAAAA